MPATGAKLVTNTRFLREDPVESGAFVALAEVKSIGGPSLSRDAVEATLMDTPDDPAEFIAASRTAVRSRRPSTSARSREPGRDARAPAGLPGRHGADLACHVAAAS